MSNESVENRAGEDIGPRSHYLTPKQASKIYPFSPSYFTRHPEMFNAIRVGGGDRRAGRVLLTREGIEHGIEHNFKNKKTEKTKDRDKDKA